MALDLLGPASAPFSTTSRPGDGRAFGTVDTWFKNCTSPTSKDGTQLQAEVLNAFLAQFRTAFRSAGLTESNVDDALLWKAMQAAAAAASGGVPIGSITLWPGGTLPAGFLKLNGALISRSTYAALTAVALASGRIVSDATWLDAAQMAWGSFSSGDGVSNIRLPDLRGEFPRFFDDGRNVDVSRSLGLAQKATSVGVTGDATNSSTGIGSNFANQVKQGDGLDGSYVNGIGSSGSTLTFYFNTVRPRNVALIPIIRAL